MNRITIYGKEGCTFCEKAKLFCRVRSLDYEYKVLGQDYDKDQLEDMIGGTVKSVPQIFIDSEHVGGYDDFTKQF